MTEFKPGTVAVATVRGKKGVRVFRVPEDALGEWRSAEMVDHAVIHFDGQVTDVRPLVVLDPQEPAFSEFVAYHGASDIERPTGACPQSYALADLIRQQTRPPRIPEPGLWGVVKATVPDSGGSRWSFVHDTDEADLSEWTCVNNGDHYDWDSLIDPALVREGVDA